MKPRLPVATSNYEKSFTYKDQMERYKLASSQGFYYECILILYAILEDRLSSFLFHAGVVNKTRLKITSNKEVKPSLIEIINPGKSITITVKKIQSKIQIMQKILVWSKSYQADETSQKYQDLLAIRLNNSSGRDEIIHILSSIGNWCEARNELVHALMNKNTEELENAIKSVVEEGYTHTRKLDNFVQSFKVRNVIRKQFNIQ